MIDNSLVTQQQTYTSQAIFPFRSNACVDFLIELIGYDASESLVTLFLDESSNVVGFYETFQGKLSSAAVDSFQILQSAVLNQATAIAVCHNHPSNSLTGSNSDRNFTEGLTKACDEIGIPLVDSMVVNSERLYSILDDKIIVLDDRTSLDAETSNQMTNLKTIEDEEILFETRKIQKTLRQIPFSKISSSYVASQTVSSLEVEKDSIIFMSTQNEPIALVAYDDKSNSELLRQALNYNSQHIMLVHPHLQNETFKSRNRSSVKMSKIVSALDLLNIHVIDGFDYDIDTQKSYSFMEHGETDFYENDWEKSDEHNIEPDSQQIAEEKILMLPHQNAIQKYNFDLIRVNKLIDDSLTMIQANRVVKLLNHNQAIQYYDADFVIGSGNLNLLRSYAKGLITEDEVMNVLSENHESSLNFEKKQQEALLKDFIGEVKSITLGDIITAEVTLKDGSKVSFEYSTTSEEYREEYGWEEAVGTYVKITEDTLDEAEVYFIDETSDPKDRISYLESVNQLLNDSDNARDLIQKLNELNYDVNLTQSQKVRRERIEAEIQADDAMWEAYEQQQEEAIGVWEENGIAVVDRQIAMEKQQTIRQISEGQSISEINGVTSYSNNLDIGEVNTITKIVNQMSKDGLGNYLGQSIYNLGDPAHALSPIVNGVYDVDAESLKYIDMALVSEMILEQAGVNGPKSSRTSEDILVEILGKFDLNDLELKIRDEIIRTHDLDYLGIEYNYKTKIPQIKVADLENYFTKQIQTEFEKILQFVPDGPDFSFDALIFDQVYNLDVENLELPLLYKDTPRFAEYQIQGKDGEMIYFSFEGGQFDTVKSEEGIQKNNRENFEAIAREKLMNQFKASGYTEIADKIEKSESSLMIFGSDFPKVAFSETIPEGAENIIYFSDGNHSIFASVEEIDFNQELSHQIGLGVISSAKKGYTQKEKMVDELEF